MDEASSTDVAGFDTALTAEGVIGAAYQAAQRGTTRQVSFLPAASAPGHPRFTMADGARAPIGVIGVRAQPATGRTGAMVSAAVEPAAGPAGQSAVWAFVAALHRVLAEQDPSVREIATTPAPAPFPPGAPAPFGHAAQPSFAPPVLPPPPARFAVPPPPPPPPPSFAAPPPPPPPPPSFAAPPPPVLAPPEDHPVSSFAPPPTAAQPAASFAPPPAAQAPSSSFTAPPAPASVAAPSFPPPATSSFLADDDDSEATVLTPRSRALHEPWRLRLTDGSTHPLPVLAVVGRRPSPPPSHPAAQGMVLPDPQRMLSKSHALIESDAEGIWVTDLGSTNGTTLLPADGTTRDCAPGERVRARPGDALLLAEVRVDIVS